VQTLCKASRRIVVTTLIVWGCALSSNAFSQGLFSTGVDSSGTGTTSAKRDSIWRDSSGISAKPDSNAVVKYQKREFNHTQQMVVGSVIMFCVALSLVAMNNYNPRR